MDILLIVTAVPAYLGIVWLIGSCIGLHSHASDE